MSAERLTVAQLLEGGLAQMRAKLTASFLFILADAFANYTILWAEGRYELEWAPTLAAAVLAYALTSSLFMLALGEAVRAALADPAELFVRLTFGLAVSVVATAATIAGLVLLIVPGLYLNARWFVSQPLVLLGGRGVLEGLRESWTLTSPSVWSLVGLTIVLFSPELAIGVFGSEAVVTHFLTPSLPLVLETVVGSAASMYSIAIVVFAYREFATRTDWLAETFA